MTTKEQMKLMDDLTHSCMPRGLPIHSGGVLGGPYVGTYPYPFDVAITTLPTVLETKDDLKAQPAHGFLKEAVSQMEVRGALRDKPSGERSMAAIVATFNALTGKGLTEAEGWEFMILLKMVRGRQGSFNRDDYVDGAAYFGLLGECESIDTDRMKK
jgi:hypothetical protein